MWSLTIEKVSNGWVIRVPPDDPENEAERIMVIEDDPVEVLSSISMLRTVAEHFGLEGGRGSAQRLLITHAPGDKHHDWHPQPCAECGCRCDPDQSGE